MSKYSSAARYRIASTENANLYWSKSIGWTDDPFEIDYFTAAEVEAFGQLHIDGKIEEVKS
jgi:hypothetical protein